MIKNIIKVVAVILGQAVVALAIPVYQYFTAHKILQVEPGGL